MEAVDEFLLQNVNDYIRSLFVPADEVLRQNLLDAQAAGLPPDAVSPVQGKLLHMIASMVRARRILEIGTLAGYSTTWLARALPPDGVLITLEIDSKRAKVARENLNRGGLGIVEVRLGDARRSLCRLIESHEEPFDLIFIDADKPSYPEYLQLSLQLSRPRTIILADNVIRNGRVAEDVAGDVKARGVKAYNDAIAADPRLESIIVPVIRGYLDGMSISIVK